MAEVSPAIENSIEKIVKSMSTLPEQQRALLNHLSVIAEGLKLKDKVNLSESAEDIEDTVEKSIREKIENDKKQQSSIDELSESQKEATKNLDIYSKSAKIVATDLYNTGKGLIESNGSFKGLADALGNIPLLGGVFSAFAGMLGVVDSTIESYRTVTMSGIQFDNGILGLMESSGELGQSLEKTSKMFAEHNTVIQRVGAPAFTNFIKEMRQSSSNLYALGFTYDDIIERSAEFLETQRNLTGLRALNEQEQKQLFNRAVDEFYDAAQMTGQGVTALLSELNKMSEDPTTRLLLQRLPIEGQAALTSIQGMSPDMAKNLMEALQKGSLERIKDWPAIMASGMGPAYQALMQAIQQGGPDTNERVGQIFKEFEGTAEFNAVMYLERGQEEYAKFAAEFAAIANRINTDGLQKAADQTIDPDTAKILDTRQQITGVMRDIREQIMKGATSLMGPDGIGPALTEGLNAFNEFLSNPENMEIITSIISGIGSFVKAIHDISKFILSAFGINSPWATALATGSGLYMGKLLLSALVKSLFKRTIGKMLSISGAKFITSSFRRMGGRYGVAATALGSAALLYGDDLVGLAQSLFSDSEGEDAEDVEEDDGEIEEDSREVQEFIDGAMEESRAARAELDQAADEIEGQSATVAETVSELQKQSELLESELGDNERDLLGEIEDTPPELPVEATTIDEPPEIRTPRVPEATIVDEPPVIRTADVPEATVVPDNVPDETARLRDLTEGMYPQLLSSLERNPELLAYGSDLERILSEIQTLEDDKLADPSTFDRSKIPLIMGDLSETSHEIARIANSYNDTGLKALNEDMFKTLLNRLNDLNYSDNPGSLERSEDFSKLLRSGAFGPDIPLERLDEFAELMRSGNLTMPSDTSGDIGRDRLPIPSERANTGNTDELNIIEEEKRFQLQLAAMEKETIELLRLSTRHTEIAAKVTRDAYLQATSSIG